MNVPVNTDILNNQYFTLPNFLNLDSKQTKTNRNTDASNIDSPEINKVELDDMDIVDIADDLLNFSSKNRLVNALNIFSFLDNSQIAEIGKFLKNLSSAGIIGWEYYEFNGEPRKVFIENTIGNPALYDKKPLSTEFCYF
ncbi:MAG TPA: hypothetical protein PKY81_04230 [bacterium]|nr:hypothetical protein [bacterium]HPN30144.1 hypothetical protein [bacterium]